jgi:hypothetical protein
MLTFIWRSFTFQDANVCPGKVLTHEGQLADAYVYSL